jgi:hypothetical protein
VWLFQNRARLAHSQLVLEQAFGTIQWGCQLTNIIDLRETSPDHWQAKYQGNYGIYTIRIVTRGGKTTEFSCSCPSDRYPCKHIAMIESAIAERITKNKQTGEEEEVRAEELLKTLSKEELYEFIARISRYNPDLTDAIILEFSHKIKSPHQNKYSHILRRALERLDFEAERNEGVDWITIDILDQWLGRARDYLEQRNYHEAVLIAQACIEEFAYWLEYSDDEMGDWVHEGYQTDPFKILSKAVKAHGADARELFNYCMEELPKEKYAEIMMHESFNNLLLELAKEKNEEIDAEAFIRLQDMLLAEVEDKSSYTAQKILQRKIDYYKGVHNHRKAWKIIEENIQIPAFRKTLAEKKIEDQDYGTAKKLIHDFLNEKDDNARRHPCEWDDLLLTIAQKEGDIPALRDISRLCINEHFEKDYFVLYKSAFTADEWADAKEELLAYYEKKERNRGFSFSVADVLAAEESSERLLSYIEKHPSIKNMEKYYAVFAEEFPERTLALFRKAIDQYAEKNLGRTSYEYIAHLLRTMTRIPNGGAIVTDMIYEYRIRYKNRRAMVEVLGKLQESLGLSRSH